MIKLDLRDPAAYSKSIGWIRDNVVLKPSADAVGVLQLDVVLPPDIPSATLFMDARNQYLMGFRGKDKIYLLNDPGTPEFKRRLTQYLGNDKNIEELGLKTSHEALGTFTRGHRGVQGRVFSLADLRKVGTLASYSRKEKFLTFELLKEPLSLLVCMISESARIPIMERDFVNMYFGHQVVADEAVRSFDDAKYLSRLSQTVFPEYPISSGVEKLQKRAAELDGLVERIQFVVGGTNRQKILQSILNHEALPNSSILTYQVKRFRDMAEELKFHKASEVTQLISTCRSESAVRAARQGVAIPPLRGDRVI